MKTLALVRHAKSPRSEVALSDKKRPLAARGRRDALKMGKRLAHRKIRPDLILSSPACRALETAKIIARKLDYRSKGIVIENSLYPGRMSELLDLIRMLGDELKCVMLFGHNPALAQLVSYLSGTDARMPTCAVAELTFNVKSWSEIGAASLAAVMLHCPKKTDK